MEIQARGKGITTTGGTVAIIDAESVSSTNARAGILNGIAAVPGTDQFLITGKYWSTMFRVRFVRSTNRQAMFAGRSVGRSRGLEHTLVSRGEPLRDMSGSRSTNPQADSEPESRPKREHAHDRLSDSRHHRAGSGPMQYGSCAGSCPGRR
ncbi:glutaminyl-peptide cyclotransferase [Streptomyces sp. NPDC087297]|uniref:glutaminyl-peptide cyclotransferase n=1 Tax=Streptomyces sp. NPDC087297 TaxID=3365778 RepID=UPI0038122ED7